jgi:hypothetical protein
MKIGSLGGAGFIGLGQRQASFYLEIFSQKKGCIDKNWYKRYDLTKKEVMLWEKN